MATMDRASSPDLSVRDWARRLISELAFQDWLVTGYLATLLLAILVFADPSPAKTQSAVRVGALLGMVVMMLIAVRGSILTRPRVVSLVYRVMLYGSVQVSYFLLRGLLPLVNTKAYDAPLLRFDLAVFGVEPALFFDRFVNYYTVEWFAFFYYGYFFVLATHVLPFLFLSRRRELFAEFAMGLFSVYCIAHTLYMVVPGWGPVKFMADQFQNPIVGGFWMQRVLEAVNGAGAQKDIFPSLHTGGPAFIFFFSVLHRDKLPFKYTWPIIGFFAFNIMIATMFLRWHYVIDVIAGLTIALSAALLSRKFAPREVAYRLARGLQPVWPKLWPERQSESPVPAPGETLPSAGR